MNSNTNFIDFVSKTTDKLNSNNDIANKKTKKSPLNSNNYITKSYKIKSKLIKINYQNKI